MSEQRQELLRKQFNAAVDSLDKTATRIRKVIRRPSTTAAEAATLLDELRNIHKLIEDVAAVRFDQLAQSSEITALTTELKSITKQLDDERDKMRTAAKTIERAANVIGIIAGALEKAAKLV